VEENARRWEPLEELFAESIELPRQSHAAFVERATASDAGLGEEFRACWITMPATAAASGASAGWGGPVLTNCATKPVDSVHGAEDFLDHFHNPGSHG
jgi:hypothetical protein